MTFCTTTSEGKVLFAMFCLQFVMMAILTIVDVWFAVKLSQQNARQQRILDLAEDYAKLGQDRKEVAHQLVSSNVAEQVNAKAEEIKLTVESVPDKTVEKMKEAVAGSGIQKTLE